jgi:hypothetical protein
MHQSLRETSINNAYLLEHCLTGANITIRFKIKFDNLCERSKFDETPQQAAFPQQNIPFRAVSLTLWFKIQFVTLCRHIKMKNNPEDKRLYSGTLLETQIAARPTFGFPAPEYFEA